LTINICLADPDAIHIACDFRLSDLYYRRLTDLSPKIVTIKYFSWEAAVVYCGIGRYFKQHTHEAIEEWLTHPVYKVKVPGTVNTSPKSPS
jgi:hypothetical protein